MFQNHCDSNGVNDEAHSMAQQHTHIANKHHVQFHLFTFFHKPTISSAVCNQNKVAIIYVTFVLSTQ